MSRQSKDPVQKCHSDPGAASTGSTPCSPGKRISRRIVPGIPSSSNTRKCVLTLDGYSYVIGKYRTTIRLDFYRPARQSKGRWRMKEGKGFAYLSFLMAWRVRGIIVVMLYDPDGTNSSIQSESSFLSLFFIGDMITASLLVFLVVRSNKLQIIQDFFFIRQRLDVTASFLRAKVRVNLDDSCGSTRMPVFLYCCIPCYHRHSSVAVQAHLQK